MECSLAEVIATKGQTFKRGLAPYRQQVGDMGIIGVYAEEHTGHKDTITFEYRSVISGQKEHITLPLVLVILAGFRFLMRYVDM